jgi:hypothetical protein
MPDYREAVRVENSRRVLQALASRGGIANFSEIEAVSGVRGSLLIHHLNRLQSLNILERETRGTYRLKYRTPLCYIFKASAELPIAYLGLLGKRDSRPKPETAVALELLREEGVKPVTVYVMTSPEALNEWKDLKLPYQWILCYEEEIINIDSIKNKILPQLEHLIKDFIVILDCTSATKPATIAYYELAQAYMTPLIYVYEETKQLKWLISKDIIKKKLGLM